MDKVSKKSSKNKNSNVVNEEIEGKKLSKKAKPSEDQDIKLENNDESEEIKSPVLKKSKKMKSIDAIQTEERKIEIVEEIFKKENKSKKKTEDDASETKKSKKMKASETDVLEGNEDDVSETKKIKKSKKRKASEIDVLEDETIPKEAEDEISKNLETPKVIENAPLFNAIIVNLPSEVSKEEMLNFLSNRGIPIDALHLNHNKYALIETENVDALTQIKAVLASKPMLGNVHMKASQLFGNQVKLSNFVSKQPVANKRVVIVKNVACTTDIEKVLQTIVNKEEIIRHNVVNVQNDGTLTQMVTIEFKSLERTDEVIAQLNDLTIDGRKLSAEHKCNLVTVDASETMTPSNALIVRNLPTNATKETMVGLTSDFGVLPRNMELLSKYGKNCCYIKFQSVKAAKEAYNKLKEDVVEGMKLEVKFVMESKQADEEELARTRLRITNLPHTLKKEDALREFDMAKSVKLQTTESGKSKGVCYVSFKTEEMAALTMDLLHDRIMGGKKLKCEYVPMSLAFEEGNNFHEKKEKRLQPKVKPTGAVLTLFNLPAGVREGDISSKFANVTLVNIVKKGDSFKGIAEVHFADAAAANVALNAPQFSMKGREIKKELKGGKWRVGTMKKAVPKKSKKPTCQSDSDDNSSVESTSE